MKCSWCGWTGTEEELDMDEHDVPMYCPECGKTAYQTGEMVEMCNKFEQMWENYEAYYDDLESYAGYYIVYITDKHLLQIPCRYEFSSIVEFKKWMEGVVLD